MSIKPSTRVDPNQPATYQIRLEGHLGAQWAAWFDDLTITLDENGNSFIQVRFNEPDQYRSSKGDK